MTGVAIILVLLSAAGHATWNLLAKRATTPEVFTWWMSAAAAVIGAPVALWFLFTDPPDAIGWAFAGGTIILHTGYFTFLGRAYSKGDLSVVYPVARGSGLALIPVVASLAIGESLSWQGAAGVAVIVTGIFIVASSSAGATGARMRWGPGVAFALLTGATIAGYSVVDKRGVEHMAPMLYVVLLTAGGGTGMLLLMRGRQGPGAFRAEFARHWVAIVAAGILQTAAYGLVLFALQLSPVSYVGPFREIGIAFGVVLGSMVLRERISRRRGLGAVVIVLGALIVAVAP